MTAPTGKLVTLQKFLSRLILLCMLPLILLATYLVYGHMQTLREQLSANADTLVHNIVTSLDNRLESQIATLQMIADSSIIDDRNRWDELQTLALNFRAGFGGHIILAGTDKQMLFNSRSPLGASLPLLPVPKGHAAAPEVLATGKPSVGDSFLGPIAGEQLVSVIVPVEWEKKIKYLRSGHFEPRKLEEILKRFSLPEGWSVVIYDSVGTVMASRGSIDAAPEKKEPGKNLNFSAESEISHWSIRLNVPPQAYLGSLVLEGSLLGIGILVAALVSFLVGRFLGNRLTRSVANISSKTPKEKSGAKIAELEAVHSELNEIAAIRDSTEEALKERELMYKALVDQASDSFFVHDFEGRFLEVNGQACDSLGYTREELLTMNVVDVEQDFNINTAQAAWAKIEPGIPFTLYGQQKRKDGSVFPVEVSFGCAVWKERKIFLGLARDITERVRNHEELERLNAELELKVAQRTQQLQEANKELEAFSFSVSHDLRAPLRAIQGFIGILNEEYAQKLDEDGIKLCYSISRNAISMSQLIEDLLTFSRISRQSIGSAWINTMVLVASVFDELTDEATKSKLVVSIGALKPCYGDEAMLRQVWTNLVSNAIKYSSKSPLQRIDVNCTVSNGFLIYSIQDNGVGFDMKYRDKLFNVFQRLHSARDFEGTGVGLALVERIIKKHGGYVGAEGEEGKGAKFWFALPNSAGDK